jgi:hypothetical protein
LISTYLISSFWVMAPCVFRAAIPRCWDWRGQCFVHPSGASFRLTNLFNHSSAGLFPVVCLSYCSYAAECSNAEEHCTKLYLCILGYTEICEYDRCSR